MKKYILLAAAAISMNAAAIAADGNPNRMLVVDANDQYKAFNIANTDRMEFATVEGDVAANVSVKNFSLTSVTCVVTRTPECKRFLFNIVPGVIAHQLEANPSQAGSYMRYLNSPEYSEDFSNGDVSGINLEYATEYAVVTVGIDMYGVDCDVRAAYFTTESAPIVGDPKVNVTLTASDYTELDLKFEPNDDVQSYWFVIGEKGTLAQQYEQFAGMFGYTNIGQMVQAWGIETTGNSTYKYTDLAPNTEYELYVQTTDTKGNMPPVQIFDFKTKTKGGSGAASVDILIGNYYLSDWDGEMKGTQPVTFTPNSETWAYRCNLYSKTVFDAQRDEILSTLPTEPPMPMVGWFYYDTFTNEFQVEPNTPYVAVAVAKNADGKWGEPAIQEFTTPLSPASAPAATVNGSSMMSRQMPVKAASQPGRVNISATGIKMIQK